VRVACGLLAILCLLPRAGAAGDPPGLAHPGLWPYARSSGLIDARTERRIDALMARMSLEEKVGQVIQGGIDSIQPAQLRRYPLGSIIVGGDPAPGEDVRAPPAVWLETMRAYRRSALQRPARHRPIPLLLAIDAAHGVGHVRGATVFPQQIGLGAAHDPELIRAIGQATAEEAAAVGFNWAFAPTVAVPQDLRWGRTYEAWSDDPALVRRYAAEAVRGLQGARGDGGGRRVRVAATAKHFVGDGATTDGRDQGDAAVSEETLVRTHVQGYVSAIDAGVMTVMVSYSSWQGVKVHGDRSLITDVLKGRMGFAGLVVGDWNGHNQIDGCSSENCPQAMNAGLDMYMAPDSWQGLFTHLLSQVRSGEIPRARLEDAVRRVLRVKFALGLFDLDDAGHPARLGSDEHGALARRAVRESLVLLKNDGHVLPVPSAAHVLVAGVGADDIGRQCGGWTLSWQGTRNRNQDFPRGESIYGGIAAAIEAGGGSVELSTEGRYARPPDVAIVVYGEQPYAESLGDRATLDFDGAATGELELLQRLHAARIPVVSVFLGGRPLWVEPELEASDAFVAAWLPGTEGAGVADVLIGDARGARRYDFSGTLSYDWPSGASGVRGPLFPYGYGQRYGDSAERTLAH
jgi:beta-glucosidase